MAGRGSNRRFRLLWLGLFLGAASAGAMPPAIQLELGHSVVPLNGPWKFAVGDSPLDPKTGQPLWAERDFDDSAWETVDLTPADGSMDPVTGVSGYVPGWTAAGHAGRWGYAWYRFRLRVAAQTAEKLAIAGPTEFDDAYQLYANGRLLGSFGDFRGPKPVVYYAQPRMFALPAEAGDTVLAFRFWLEPNTLLNLPDAGGFHDAPLLGDAGTIAALHRNRWTALLVNFAAAPVQCFLYLLLAAGAFSLTIFDRTDRVYWWTGAIFLARSAINAVGMVADWSEGIGITAASTVADVAMVPLIYVGWLVVWWVWFRLRKPAWVPRAIVALAALYVISNALGLDLYYELVPHRLSVVFHGISLAVRLLLLAMMVWIAGLGIRRQGPEGWFVLPAIALLGVEQFSDELAVLHVPTNWFPLGIRVSLYTVANFLLVLALALLLLRRLMLSIQRQRLMALDVKQAQEVQRVILPEARLAHGSFAIETVYRPAREVGGDFFQVIPDSAPGLAASGLLIVAGDVAGKGLQAGMLVALLVGAIRTVVRFERDPAAVLRELNLRLLGRGDAAATCLAMRIEPDGAVTLANAGHMPPYRNGEPVPMEGALPLGLFAGAEPSLMRFSLERNDRLMLLSDGIVEARNAQGELFGFERLGHLLREPVSAAEVADAAQNFGQDDDISAICVTRGEGGGPIESRIET